jgi:hypothetical protein
MRQMKTDLGKWAEEHLDEGIRKALEYNEESKRSQDNRAKMEAIRHGKLSM